MEGISIGRVPLIVQCGHLSGAEVLWVNTKPGEIPQFCFSRFPHAGRIALSNDTIVLACHRCAKTMDDIISTVDACRTT